MRSDFFISGDEEIIRGVLVEAEMSSFTCEIKVAGLRLQKHIYGGRLLQFLLVKAILDDGFLVVN